MFVCECTSKTKAPTEDAGGVTNIRWVPEGVSTFLESDYDNAEYISEAPSLKLEYKGGDLEGMIEEFTPDKVYSIGRADDNDVVLGLAAVSRKHAKIFYEEGLGWIIQDLGSTSGTWVHPKTYSKARVDVENSMPVLLRNGMIIKAHTYAFQFN